MFEMVIDSEVHPAVARLHAALTDVTALDLAALPTSTLLAVSRDLEAVARRLPSLDHAVIGEMQARGVAAEVSRRDTKVLLIELLRLSPGEATARVRAAQELGPRRSLGGQPLPVVFEHVAAAQADGTISVAHAKVITTMITALPDTIRDNYGDETEKFMVSKALEFNPHVLGQLGHRVTALLDPDGTLSDEDHHNKRRGLTITRHADGSGWISGYLTPILLAALQAVLDSLAAPNPDHVEPSPPPAPGDSDIGDCKADDGVNPNSATDGDPDDGDAKYYDGVHPNSASDGDGSGASPEVSAAPKGGSAGTRSTSDDEMSGGTSGSRAQARRDPRSSPQRRHDAMLAVCQRLLQSGTLPSSGGTPATILLTMAYSDLVKRTGFATTGAGDLISVPDAVKLAGDAGILPVYMSDTGGVMNYGRTKRLATSAQRRALAARDGGCTFPGCTMPADWCQVHHLDDWIDGGETDINRMALACSYNHLTSIPEGWECIMINGIPHWRPPAWLDPDRTPIRNTANHPALRFEMSTAFIDG